MDFQNKNSGDLVVSQTLKDSFEKDSVLSVEINIPDSANIITVGLFLNGEGEAEFDNVVINTGDSSNYTRNGDFESVTSLIDTIYHIQSWKISKTSEQAVIKLKLLKQKTDINY